MNKRKTLDDQQLADMLERIIVNCAVDHRSNTLDAQRDPTAQEIYVAHIFMDYGFDKVDDGETPSPMMMRVEIIQDYGTCVKIENIDLDNDDVRAAISLAVDFISEAAPDNPCKSASDVIVMKMKDDQGFTLDEAHKLLERLIFEGHWDGDGYVEQLAAEDDPMGTLADYE